jgi:signal transduction histidine kinase
MKKSIKYLFVLFVFNFLRVYGNSDSLDTQLKSMIDDSNKVNLLNRTSRKFMDINTDKGLEYSHYALEIATKLNYKHGIAVAYKNIGLNYWRSSDYDIAIDNEIKALAIFEELNDFKETANLNNNIGLIFMARTDMNKAKYYFYKSSNLSNRINDKIGVARSLANLGIVLEEEKKYDSALIYHRLSLKNLFETKDSFLISMNYCFIGKLLISQNKLDSALKYIKMSEEIYNKMNSLNDIAIVKNLYSLYFYKTKNYLKAINYADEAFNLGTNIGNKFMQMEAYYNKSRSYAAMKKYKEAYDCFNKFKDLRDTLQDEDKIKSITQKETQYIYDKKLKELELNQKNELYKNKVLFVAALIFSVILLITILIILLFYKAKIKANLLLTDKNNEILLQKNELDILNTKLVELNSTKDKFFSIIAHDLKNPLGSFKVVTNLMHENYNDFDENERIEYIELMKNSSNNLYALLENLLEWSRSQSGKIEFIPVEIDLKFLVDNTINLLKTSFENKNISIVSNIDDSLIVNADSNMINTVLRNLISNAVKFTPIDGKIEIGAAFQPSEGSKPSEGYTVIYVKDIGVGMDEKIRNKLFRIDTYVTNIGTAGEKGTGLGLILCKEFVEKHGGKIWVESEEGKGSTFYFSLPKVS